MKCPNCGKESTYVQEVRGRITCGHCGYDSSKKEIEKAKKFVYNYIKRSAWKSADFKELSYTIPFDQKLLSIVLKELVEEKKIKRDKENLIEKYLII